MHHCGVDLVQMVQMVVVIATIVIELELFVCFSPLCSLIFLVALVAHNAGDCNHGVGVEGCQSWLSHSLQLGAVYHNSFSTVFLDSFSHLYFSAAYLNCTSPAVLLSYISRLNSG